MSRSTFKQASNAILESDLVLFLLDATGINFENTIEIIKYIQSLDKEYLIVVNKIDLLKKDEYLKKIENIQDKLNTKNVFTISAIKAIGIKSLLQYIEKNFTFFYKNLSEVKSINISTEFVEEVVREKVLNFIHEEVPYNLKFQAENISIKKDRSYVINMSILLSKNSHRPIVIGRSGEKIKKIGIYARKDLENIYKKKIHLFLHIKVKKNRRKIDNLEG